MQAEIDKKYVSKLSYPRKYQLITYECHRDQKKLQSIIKLNKKIL